MNVSFDSLLVNINNITPFDLFVNLKVINTHIYTKPYSGVYSSIVYTVDNIVVDNIVVDCIVVVKNLSIVVCVVVDCIVVVDPTLPVVHTVRLL